ncbi:MAG: alanyl-tRNA editing protein [Candidatus Heimdallarchaeota archaeon]|nr:alanyl-tRNA editing protein [Candidatus Heimdallarchaeota archaeon]
MTKLLFQDDSYLRTFEAYIIEIIDDHVVLNQTAFAYMGGGLQSDSGFIKTQSGDKYEMLESYFKGGKVLHKLSQVPKESLLNEKVTCTLDWEKRYKQMRLHTALHSLSGLLFNKYGSTVTGGNITPEKSRVDFEIDHLRQERVEEIVSEINKILVGDHPVSISYMNRDDALKIPDLIRTKVNLIPESVKTIRIVEIKGVDMQADGGVHIANTKEIGEFVSLKSENRGKNNKRLYFTVKP